MEHGALYRLLGYCLHPERKILNFDFKLSAFGIEVTFCMCFSSPKLGLLVPFVGPLSNWSWLKLPVKEKASGQAILVNAEFH